MSVLGACLLSRNAAIEVSEFLKADDFYRSAHRTVFEAVQELMARFLNKEGFHVLTAAAGLLLSWHAGTAAGASVAVVAISLAGASWLARAARDSVRASPLPAT